MGRRGDRRANRHLWRVVDAAYDRLACTECGSRLSRGPSGCAACDLANGFRYVAIEVDRPGVPPGNEHALRVNVSVVRRPSGISWREVAARRLSLPFLLDGHLPTIKQAQAARALLNQGGTAEDLAEHLNLAWGNAHNQLRPAARKNPRRMEATSAPIAELCTRFV